MADEKIGRQFVPELDIPVGTVKARPNKHTNADGSPRVEWLNPIAMSMLKRAVLKRSKTVVLNGKPFDIGYGEIFNLPASGDTRECVKLTPSDGTMVPMGYVPIDKIRAFEFEEGRT